MIWDKPICTECRCDRARVGWQVLQLVDFNVTRLVCDADQLSLLLLVPPGGVTAEEMSRALCDIDEALIPDITDTLLAQLNVSALADIVSQLFNR